MTESLLFSPTTLGSLTLKNRVVMGPMTRSRSIDNIPGPIVATYYAQRAEAGLIVTEGTSPSPNGLGYARIPGLFNAAQVAGWKAVTDAVHKAGGKIFVQLMHTGRIGAPQNLPPGAKVVGPSAVAAPGKMYTDAAGMQDHPTPHALTDAEVEATLDEYTTSAKLAMEAGFDGIELHGANGYLIEQFLNTASNKRDDKWGGSVANRARFAVEAARRCAAAIGADKVGIRLSPYGVFNSMETDAETDALYMELAKQLSALKIVYIHMVDHSAQGAPKPSEELVRGMRAAFSGTFILSGGYDAKRAEADLQEKRGDLIGFASKFISNPKLVSKLKSGEALTPPDPSTFYTPGEKGYTDYV
ncbi:MAG: alkene reductase [Polyangiaceae bacterium]